MYTSGGQEYAQLSRLWDVLPSLCENAVNSVLAWSFSRWSDSSACSARTQGAMKAGRAPDESPVSVRSANTYIMGWQPHQIWSYGPLKSAIFHGFGSCGWIRAGLSPKAYILWTWDLHHWIQQRLTFKRKDVQKYCDNPIRFGAMGREISYVSWIWHVGEFVLAYLLNATSYGHENCTIGYSKDWRLGYEIHVMLR